MNQTFIDMLIAIKDPVAVEKAYNIMAAKREMLATDAGKDVGKPVFPAPPSRIYEIQAGDAVELKGATTSMLAQGFYNGQLFHVVRRHSRYPNEWVIAKCERTGALAPIKVDYVKRVHS